MCIQDEFWQRSGQNKWEVVREHMRKSKPKLGVLQVQFTSATNLPMLVPLDFAREINPKLARYLVGGKGCGQFVGILAMDFPMPHLCDLILRRNWISLNPLRPACCSGILAAGRAASRSGSNCSRFAGRGQLSDVKEAAAWLEDMQCELMAAACRADAATENVEHRREEDPEVPAALHWLSRVYTRFILERLACELCEPAVDDTPKSEVCEPDKSASLTGKSSLSQDRCRSKSNLVEVSNSVPSETLADVASASASASQSPTESESQMPLQSKPATSSSKSSGGFFSRLSRRFRPEKSKTRADACGGSGNSSNSPTAAVVLNQSQQRLLLDAGASQISIDAAIECILCHTSDADFIENLRCELQAATSRADAAAIAMAMALESPSSSTTGTERRSSEELDDKLKWLSRVFVKLVVETARNRGTAAIASGDPTAITGLCAPPQKRPSRIHEKL
eukprot:TRINITY_DN16278_c1_g1_i1.p1 TRINITY_DN16278_c1_g1~~TRINITY_DN16278_c1_g1_i1.p1  ORF type:complete len:452 (-),score=90.40 TRINITY_DN16278_c1_g1_i1:273-1628(-)